MRKLITIFATAVFLIGLICSGLVSAYANEKISTGPAEHVSGNVHHSHDNTDNEKKKNAGCIAKCAGAFIFSSTVEEKKLVDSSRHYYPVLFLFTILNSYQTDPETFRDKSRYFRSLFTLPSRIVYIETGRLRI